VTELAVTDSQPLIDVHAIALNFGELHFIELNQLP
jgi:hypothetical protein